MTRASRLELLQWFGLLAAPVAWAAHLVAGYFLVEAHCAAMHFASGWTRSEMGLTASAALVAVLAEWAAVTVYFELRAVDGNASGPPGRQRFLAQAAMVGNVLFFLAILLTGVTAVEGASCRQA